MRPLVAAVAALALLGAACSPAETADHTVPFALLEGTSDSALALVPLFLEGQGPVMFALDTGSSETLIDRRVADELGLPPIEGSERTVLGAAGPTEAVEVAVQTWRLGTDVELPPTRLASLELPEPPDSPLQGLLGSDVLSRFSSVTIDYERRELRIQNR